MVSLAEHRSQILGRLLLYLFPVSPRTVTTPTVANAQFAKLLELLSVSTPCLFFNSVLRVTILKSVCHNKWEDVTLKCLYTENVNQFKNYNQLRVFNLIVISHSLGKIPFSLI